MNRRRHQEPTDFLAFHNRLLPSFADRKCMLKLSDQLEDALFLSFYRGTGTVVYFEGSNGQRLFSKLSSLGADVQQRCTSTISEIHCAVFSLIVGILLTA